MHHSPILLVISVAAPVPPFVPQVAEHSSRRVQEVNVRARTFVRFIGVGDLVNPTGVAASADLIAVAGAWFVARPRVSVRV